jgi:hypothetical protein
MTSRLNVYQNISCSLHKYYEVGCVGLGLSENLKKYSY